MKARYRARLALAMSRWSTSRASCPKNQSLTQLYFPYLMTCRYGGEVKTSFGLMAFKSSGAGLAASPSQDRPLTSAFSGRSYWAALARSISNTSTSGASSSWSWMYFRTYPGAIANVFGMLIEKPLVAPPLEWFA